MSRLLEVADGLPIGTLLGSGFEPTVRRDELNVVRPD
jgi:hypothetical protein